MYWLGIDIGTGGTRALLVDERGAVKVFVYGSSRRHAHGAAAMGRAAAGELVGCCAAGDSRRTCKKRESRARIVRGIGLSGQMHGLTLLDASDDSHSARADLVRSAQPGAGGLCQHDSRTRQGARVHGQSRGDRLHAA